MISSLGWTTTNVSQMLLRGKECSPLRRRINCYIGVCVCVCVCDGIVSVFYYPFFSPSLVPTCISFLRTSLSSTSSLFPPLPLLYPPSPLSHPPSYPPPLSSLSSSSLLLTLLPPSYPPPLSSLPSSLLYLPSALTY